jgi:hypothetical protein
MMAVEISWIYVDDRGEDEVVGKQKLVAIGDDAEPSSVISVSEVFV